MGFDPLVVPTLVDNLKKRVIAESKSIMNYLGLNSIEFQQDVQQGFQQSILHSVVLNALLEVPLNRDSIQLNFNRMFNRVFNRVPYTLYG